MTFAVPTTRTRTFAAKSAAAAVIVVCGLGANMPTALYGVLRDGIGFSAAVQTAIFGAYVLGILPGLLIVGPLSDRYGRRPILLLALTFAVIASVGFLHADSVLTLVIIRVLQGVSVGAATVAGVACFFESMPTHRASVAALLATGTTALGAAFGPPVGGAVAEVFDRSVAAPYLLELGLAVLVAGLLFLIRSRPAVDSVADTSTASSALPGRLPNMVMTCLLAALSWVGVGLFQSVGPALLAQSLGITHLGVLGAAVALVMGASAITTVFARQWPVPRQRGTGLVLLTIACGCLALTLTSGSASLAVLAALGIGVAHGFIFLGTTRDIGILSAARNDGKSARVTGVYYAVAYIGSGLPTLGVGLLAGFVGLIPATLILLSLVGAVSLSLAVREAGRRLTEFRVAKAPVVVPAPVRTQPRVEDEAARCVSV